MPHRNPNLWVPWLMAAAFLATLSLLTLRDRLDLPTRVQTEPSTAAAVVIAVR
jgi:hypothetical protein